MWKCVFGKVVLGGLVLRGMGVGVSKGSRVWMPCRECVGGWATVSRRQVRSGRGVQWGCGWWGYGRCRVYEVSR